MYNLLKKLFPIYRSITGDGVRESLSILKDFIPLTIHEVPTGTAVFDWSVPKEWNIKTAYIKDSKGNTVVSFDENNLHIVGYSVPFKGRVTLAELKKHIYTIPETPNAIPYITSYYKETWGFCMTHKQYESMQDDYYEVLIDSSLDDGFLTYGELIIPGESKEEILLSTYICHPGMANNELSGPVVTTFLSKYLLEQKNYYTYRILFIPETIGSITYISRNFNVLKQNVIGGYVLTCCGDNSLYSYLKTRSGDAVVDRITQNLLKNDSSDNKIYEYLERGSDERQYNSPGVDLNIGSLMRSKYDEYPEYHTSLDNLDFVSEDGLKSSLDMYKKCLLVFENNKRYKLTTLCEPQLGKHGLYPTMSTRDTYMQVKTMVDFLAYCDGECDLVSIADKINVSAYLLIPLVRKLSDKNIIEVLC